MHNYLNELNENQRIVATLTKNTAVSAGAGSGKTKVLSKRFVYLVLEKKIDIKRILALTFTKKAATEMKERIYNELLNVLATTNNTAEKEILQTAIYNFSESHISTLDSFCATIARSGSAYFGINPNFKIDKEICDRIADECTLRAFMKFRNDSDLIQVLKQPSFEVFINDFFKAFLRYVTITKPIDIVKAKEKFLIEIDNIFKELTETFYDIAQDIISFENTSEHENVEYIQNLLSSLCERPTSFTDKKLEDFFEIVEKVEKIDLRRTPRNENAKQGFNAPAKILRDTVCKSLSSLYLNYKHQDLILHCFGILGEVQNDFIQSKLSQNVLDHGDVSQLAVDSLLNIPELRKLYKLKFDAIMIDEFQDNNSLQRDLLFLLSEKLDEHSEAVPLAKQLVEDKLFFVGDEKQSIYLFRGADVSVFKRLSNEFAENATVPLNTNYRTEKSLIHFFNFLFPGVFAFSNPLSSNNEHDYEANFSPINPHKETESVFPSVLVYASVSTGHDGEKFLNPVEAEAYTLAFRINEMIKEGVTVSDGGKMRSCKFSDFAVLFRTTTNQHVIEKFFRLFNIPYKTVQQKGIFNDAPINDMLSIIRLAISPYDRFTFAQVLRSPFANLSDTTVVKLLLQKDGDLFTLQDENLDAFESKKLNNLRLLFERVQDAVRRLSSSEIISMLWYEEGYRYCILQKDSYKRYLELYDYLFEIARQCDESNKSIYEFLQTVDSYISQDTKLDDMEIPTSSFVEDENSVKLLTIHKSKGLEYKIVCLPFCASPKKTTKIGSVLYSEKYGLSISLTDENDEEDKTKSKNIFFDRSSELERKKEVAELRRLFYVALTRAECHIIMTGARVSKSPKHKDKIITEDVFKDELYENFSIYGSKVLDDGSHQLKVELSFYDMFFESLTDEVMEEIGNILTIKEIVPIPISTRYGRFSETPKKNTETILQLAKLSTKKDFVVEKKVYNASHLHDDVAFEAQTLYSSQISEISALDLGIYAHAAIEARFENKSVTLPKSHAALIEAWCDTFFSSALGKFALVSKNRKTEYGFITRYDNKTVIGKIDLVFEHDNHLYLIDYKTDRVEEPSRHEIQLGVYKKACADLFNKNESEISAALFYLRTGNIVYV